MPTETPTNSSAIEDSSLQFRDLQLEDVKLLLEQKEQVRRLNKNKDGLVAHPVLRYENGQSSKPDDDDDDDQLLEQRDNFQKVKELDEQRCHEGLTVNKTLGKTWCMAKRKTNRSSLS